MNINCVPHRLHHYIRLHPHAWVCCLHVSLVSLVRLQMEPKWRENLHRKSLKPWETRPTYSPFKRRRWKRETWTRLKGIILMRQRKRNENLMIIYDLALPPPSISPLAVLRNWKSTFASVGKREKFIFTFWRKPRETKVLVEVFIDL